MSLLVAKLGPENEWCEQASVQQLMCDILDAGFGIGATSVPGQNGGILGNGVSGLVTAGGLPNDIRDGANSLLPLILK